jgi:hypothetical protein
MILLIAAIVFLITLRILSSRYVLNAQEFLFETLIQEPLVDIESRLHNAYLLKANRLIKKYKENTKLQNAITAFKVGIPFELLLKNLDFADFARVNAIHRYLLVYNHELRYDHDKIYILYEGVYCDFSTISRYVMNSRKELKGQYSQNGIIHNYMFEWESLTPFIRALKEDEVKDDSNISTGLPVLMKHDWGNRYVLEICSWIIANPRLTGDHLWHRLKTPEGDVYSVGQYRPRKLQGHEQFIFPMKIKTSQFYSPDLCEFWTGPYTTLSFEITESQFLIMKEKMELDQKRQEHVYQLFEDNCVGNFLILIILDYTMSICKIAGVFFPTKLPISDILIQSKRLKKAKYSIWNSDILPDIVKQMWHYGWVLFLNGVALILGAGLIDAEVSQTH